MRIEFGRKGTRSCSGGTVYRSTGKPTWQQRLATAVCLIGGVGMLAGGNTLDKTNWGLPVMLLGGLVMGCGIWWTQRTLKAAIEKVPIQQLRACVTGRRVSWEDVGGRWVKLFYLCFETKDGGSLELNVSEYDHNRWNDGDEGVLRYRDWQFLSFSQMDLQSVNEE